MRLGFAARLFLLAVGIVGVSVLAASAYLATALERQLLSRIEDDLAVRVALLQERVALAAPSGPAEWDALADELGARAAARVTIIRADGVVLGDSTLSLDEVAHLENHAGRPEVQAAIRATRGAATRFSDTRHMRMMYVALPFDHRGQLAGVVRVAVPVSEVDAAIASARHALIFGASLALGVAFLSWAVATRRISLLVRSLTATARRLARGDLEARARVTGKGELAELGATLDGLAANLTRAIGELRDERDLLSGVLEAMDEGVLLVTEGQVALVNRALREMLLLPSDVVGRPPLEAIRHAELQRLSSRALEEAGPVSGEIEVAGVKPRRLLVHARALPGEEQEAVLMVFVDVTDLRRLETLRRDFVANVSHELRTPVTAIRTAAETLRDSAAGDEVARPKFLEVIDRNAARLQSLVEDVLDLSRIDSRQYQLRPESVDLTQVMVLVEEGLRERAARRRVAVRSELPAGSAVQADRRALEQVLTNLVENAVKYGAEGTEVVTRAAAAGDKVTIAVADTGPGIEARHLPRIFERFYRVDAGRSRDQGGTGLGLAIVKNLVEAMGGSVGVESVVGKGSTFKVTLPAAAEARR